MNIQEAIAPGRYRMHNAIEGADDYVVDVTRLTFWHYKEVDRGGDGVTGNMTQKEAGQELLERIGDLEPEEADGEVVDLTATSDEVRKEAP